MEKFLLIFGVFTCVFPLCEGSAEEDLIEMVGLLTQQMSSVDEKVNLLTENMYTVNERLNMMQGQINIIEASMDDRLKDNVKLLEQRLFNPSEDTVRTEETQSQAVVIPEKYQFSSFGCLGSTISLACSENKTIFVITADFGQYDACPSGCCPPNPGRDCVELVEETRPQDWLAIKALCDNQTSCQFDYLGSLIDSCQSGYTADYMAVYYTCIPEDENGPVGFLVLHNENREYGKFEMVVFDSIDTNLGGHFQPASSTFICPATGLYLFSVSIYSVTGEAITVEIMKENEQLVNAWADNDSDSRNQASNTAIVQCDLGQRVFVMVGGADGTLYGSYDRTSFSGVLIQRFD